MLFAKDRDVFVVGEEQFVDGKGGIHHQDFFFPKGLDKLSRYSILKDQPFLILDKLLDL